jgi:hypothetical protein
VSNLLFNPFPGGPLPLFPLWPSGLCIHFHHCIPHTVF